MNKIIVIGIAGGTASGKSTLAQKLHRDSKNLATIVIRMDDYYKNNTHLSFEERTRQNYDHPNAFDTALLVEHLQALKKGRAIQQPIYDFKKHMRSAKTAEVKSAPVIILEGIMLFAIPELLAEIDYKIFVDTPADIRLLRRIKRDIEERGRDLQSVSDQYLATVRPMHDLYVEPSKVHADIIVPEGGYNKNAADLLLTKVASLVRETKF